MAVSLIIGPYQSGKTRRLWEHLARAELGTAVLITPSGILTRDQVACWFAAFGPGLLPATLSLEALFAALAPATAKPLTPRLAAHLVRAWCAAGALDDGVLAPIARFRATAADLADTALRCDAQGLHDDDLDLARRTLARTQPHLVRKLAAIVPLAQRLARSGLVSRGRQLAGNAAPTQVLPWSTLVFDDLISLAPAELQALRRLATQASLVISAVEDARLQRGSLLAGLRATFPDAQEERLTGVHPRAAHGPAQRQVLAHLLTDHALPPQALAFYHYRDDAHAGRAIAAWLRRQRVSPGEATLYLRVMGGSGLAIADSLGAAGVPVRGSFTVPLGSTAAGGLVVALAAWCEEPSWERFLAVCERLALALPPAAAGDTLPGRVPPTPVRHLRGSWAQLRAEAGLARLASLLEDSPQDGQEWQEPGPGQPWLTATVGWLSAWLAVLTPAGAGWLADLGTLCTRLALDAVDELLVSLSELQALAPVGAQEARDQLAGMGVTVERGAQLDAASALLIVDAVRGRTEPRAVALVHGLEHGLWPAAPRRGVCLSTEERRSLSQVLDGRDPWDEAGQASGEIASFLAVVARGTRQVVLGMPCGERIPSPWLGGICAQLGRDLTRERAGAASEAMPGAPLSAADSQGDHEVALWTAAPRRASFRFTLPQRPAAALHVTASRLNELLQDPFAFVLTTLRVQPALDSVSRRLDGQQLHELLAELVRYPHTQWGEAGAEVIARWIDLSADPLSAVARRRASPQVAAAIAAEQALLAGCESQAERRLEIPIPHPVPGQGILVTLRGLADRIDRWSDGRQRIVDYKYAPIHTYRTLLRQQHEGQLAAYAAAVGMHGPVDSAHYRSVLDGEAAGYLGATSPEKLGRDPPDIGELPERLERIGAAILAIAEGIAITDPEDGLCEERGYAPLARLDEARLELPSAAGEDEE